MANASNYCPPWSSVGKTPNMCHYPKVSYGQLASNKGWYYTVLCIKQNTCERQYLTTVFCLILKKKFIDLFPQVLSIKQNTCEHRFTQQLSFLFTWKKKFIDFSTGSGSYEMATRTFKRPPCSHQAFNMPDRYLPWSFSKLLHWVR